MALITPAKPQIDFCLRTTKPFHNRKAAQDFFDWLMPMAPITGPLSTVIMSL